MIKNSIMKGTIKKLKQTKKENKENITPVSEKPHVGNTHKRKKKTKPAEEFSAEKKQDKNAKINTPSQKKPKKEKPKLRIIPLGGVSEIGENMMALEYGNDIIVIDCGVGFPDEDMPGIDLVIPDISYLEENKDKLRGIVLTHGHEDHIGAVPYVLRSINPPIYGTKLTLGIIQNKLGELKPPNEPVFKCVKAGDVVRLGVFSVEFIRVNHSIADACCLAIKTRCLGDFTDLCKALNIFVPTHPMKSRSS